MKHLLLTAAALVGTAALSTASANVILVFGQNGTTNTAVFTATPGNPASTTITDTASVTITAIDPLSGILTPVTALFNLTANSIANTTGLDNQNTLSERFSGSFSITSGAINYLSGTFTDIVSGLNAGTSATMTSSQPPELVAFTSSVIPLADLGYPESFSLSFTNMIFGDSGVCTSPMVPGTAPACTIGSTTGSVSGTFAAVPGPIAGAGLPGLIAAGAGLLAFARRRRRKAEA